MATAGQKCSLAALQRADDDCCAMAFRRSMTLLVRTTRMGTLRWTPSSTLGAMLTSLRCSARVSTTQMHWLTCQAALRVHLMARSGSISSRLCFRMARRHLQHLSRLQMTVRGRVRLRKKTRNGSRPRRGLSCCGMLCNTCNRRLQSKGRTKRLIISRMRHLLRCTQSLHRLLLLCYNTARMPIIPYFIPPAAQCVVGCICLDQSGLLSQLPSGYLAVTCSFAAVV